MHLVEGGIIKHLSLKNLPKAEICPQDLGSIERQLRNGDLLMTYYIMLVGFIISAVIFFTELFFRFVNEHYGQKTDTDTDMEIRRVTRNSRDKKKTAASPPPPYQSVYRWENEDSKDNTKNNWLSSLKPFKQQPSNNNGFGFLPKTLEEPISKRRFINGREYYVSVAHDGTKQLIPVRVPSATLFQYNYAS